MTYRKITKDELETILRKHKLWLCGEEGGERADLESADLRRADLYGADLESADLESADLYGANLESADLYGANLYGADLRSANLRSANLYGADLRSANLRSANLYGADLYGANLRRANLYGADLRSANLYGANLRSANLYGANLESANLESTRGIPPIACPEKGSFIGFKKASGYIVELEICEDALRSSATSRKCRCSHAKVLSITKLGGADAGVDSVLSSHDKRFLYTVGETVSVSNFDLDRWNECSTGIHFFITRQEAVDYNN